MPDPCDIERLLARIDEATKQITRVKDSIRRRHILTPDADDNELSSALEYWEDCKREAETELRRASR